eukprot:scaffold4240_cov73-Phaeocystis_antarctica.AAC.7
MASAPPPAGANEPSRASSITPAGPQARCKADRVASSYLSCMSGSTLPPPTTVLDRVDCRVWP